MALTKVTTSLVAINTLTAANIADNAIDATKIAQNNIVARHIPNATALVLDGGVTIDNITIDGTEIDLSSGSLTVDVAGDIYLDADGGDIVFKDGGTDFGEFSSASNNLTMKSSISDADIKFNGNDGGSAITALTLDMSAAGAASFNAGITSAEAITVTNGNSTFSTASSWGKTLTLKNTNDDAGPAYLSLEKAPSSGHSTMADNDYIGFINMRGLDDAGNAHTYVELSGVATDVSNGAETSKFSINTWGAGTEYANSLVVAGGKVGIGTASPDTHVHISTSDRNIIKFHSSYGTERTYYFRNDSGVLNIGGGSPSDANDLLNLDVANDRVGIGTKTPAGILHVDEGAADDARIIAETHAGGDSMILFSQGASGAGSPTWGVGLDATNDVLSIGFEDTGYDDFSLTSDSKLVIDTSGNVGIGTTSPSQKLHVSGNLQVPDANTIYAGNIYIAGRMGHKDDQYAYIDWSTNTMDLAANVIKLKGGSTTGLQELYFNNGQMTLADDASYTISSARNTGVIIIVGSSKSSGGTTYDTAMFFGDYGTNELVEIADPSSKWSVGTSTDGVANIGISGNSDVVITNKVGNSSNFSIAVIRTQGL